MGRAPCVCRLRKGKGACASRFNGMRRPHGSSIPTEKAGVPSLRQGALAGRHGDGTARLGRAGSDVCPKARWFSSHGTGDDRHMGG